jgi:hypothetical protein
VDESISEFEDAVRRHDGEWWAPTSEFSCSKEELVEELIERRHAAQYGDEYRRLAGLLVASTRFVPEVDLANAAPYMSEGGGISGRLRSDAADEPARVRSYDVFEAHRAAGKALIHRIGVDTPYRRPISSAPYAVSGNKYRGSGAQWYFIGLLVVVPAILWERLKRIRKS